MNTELEQLSLTFDFIADDDAKKILGIVNSKLEEVLNAHIIDVLWRTESKDGPLLQPYIYLDRTERGGPLPYTVTDSASGIWTWVFNHATPVWLEAIGDLSREHEAPNRIGGSAIEPRYLEFYKDTDSIFAMPLIFKDTVRGIYSVELPDSGRISDEILHLIRQMSFAIANVIWKAEAYRLNREQTSKVIERFRSVIAGQDLRRGRVRTGFIARPFGQEFDAVEKHISSYINAQGIRAQCYTNPPGGAAVLAQMKEQITDCHFGIVDISGLNPNVLTELGMIMILGKEFLLLRRHGDEAPLPSNLSGIHCYEYQVESAAEVRVLDVVAQQFVAIEPVLDAFIAKLREDPRFKDARKFVA